MFYYGLSLLMLLPAGGLILVLLVAYLIYNRYQENKTESFEKRNS